MDKPKELVINVSANTETLQKQLRVIAKHLEALANELDELE